ncbi:hypothetical protein DYH09_17490 [bacterium CPR1]|nr:hypothetical protein [bacterium CPR1]
MVAGLILLSAFLDRPGSPASPPWIALAVGGGLTVVSGALLTRRGVPREATVPAFLFCLLVLERSVTTWFSLDPFRSQINLCSWLVALALYLVIVTGIQSLADWRRYAASAVCIILGFSLWAFASYEPNGPVAGFSNHDSFAFLPLTSVLLCAGLMQGRDDWRWWMCGAIFVIAFLLVGGRTASGALLAGGLAIFWVYRARMIPPEARQNSLSGGVLLLALTAMAIFLVFVRPQLPSLSHTIGDADAERLRWRRDVLWQSASLVPDRLLTGSGPGTFSLAFQELSDQEPEAKSVASPQNDLMESLVETGLPGALLWGLVLSSTFFLTYSRALEVIDPTLPPDWSALGALGAMVAASTFSLLFAVISLPATLCWMAALLALATRSGQDTEPAPPPSRFSLLLGLVLALAGLWVLSFGWRGFLASRAIERGTVAADSLLLEEALPDFERATRHAPNWWRTHYEKARVLRLLAVESVDSTRRNKAIEELEQARRCSPRELAVLALLAGIHLEACDPARAAEVYALGVQWAPSALGFKRGLLNARLQQGALEEALPIALELYGTGTGTDKPASIVLCALAARDHVTAGRLLQQSKLSEDALMGLLQETEARARQAGLAQIAAPLYSVWLEKHPDDWGILVRQARLLIEGGQENEGASRVAELRHQVPANDPASVEVLCTWAMLARARGQATEARIELEKRLQESPELIEVRRVLARMLVEDGDLEEALARIDEGLLNDPDEPELLTLKARILLERGSLDAALEYASLVLAAQPDNREAAEIRQKAMKGFGSP